MVVYLNIIHICLLDHKNSKKYTRWKRLSFLLFYSCHIVFVKMIQQQAPLQLRRPQLWLQPQQVKHQILQKIRMVNMFSPSLSFKSILCKTRKFLIDQKDDLIKSKTGLVRYNSNEPFKWNFAKLSFLWRILTLKT